MTQEPMTSKEKRVMEAHRLRYMEDLNSKEIAKRLNVKPQTVRTYFSDAESEKFKRFYSDQQRFRLEQSLEQDVNDGNKLANNLLARAIQHEEAKPSTLVRATKEAQKIRERKIKMLQELGVIEKPKQRGDESSEGDGSGSDVLVRMQEAFNELEAQEEKVEVESE